MASDRQDYPAMASQLQPSHAADILNERVRQIGTLNTNIASWLAERRRLEEQYAAGLRRLARKNIDDVDLGVFSVPWAAITNSADTTADSHTALAAKIEADVERPLREFNSNSREMQAMTTIQGNTMSMAKDVDRARAKSDKLAAKGDREGSKVDGANQELSNATEAWQNQAPFIFGDLQSLDETRLNKLRDCLTQLQTHELDQLEKNRQSAEHCLNSLLSVETADEIKTFALKALASQPSAERARRPSQVDIFSTPSRAPPPSSDRLTPVVSQPDDSSVTAPSDKRKSRLGGLKRLGTVVGGRSGRKRESKMPSMDETPEPKEKKSGFRFGRSKNAAAAIPETPQEEEESRQGTPQRPSGPPRIGSEVLEPTADRNESTAERSASAVPQVNGTTLALLNGHQEDLTDIEPPRPVEPSVVQAPVTAAEPERNLGAFAPPPAALDPISQAEQEAAAAAPALNVNIRNEPIRDENAEVALNSMAGKLQAPPARASTIRGRRQAASTYIAPEQAPRIRDNSAPAPMPPPPVPEERAVAAVSPPPPIPASTNSLQSLPTTGLVNSPSGNLAPGTMAGAGLPIAAGVIAGGVGGFTAASVGAESRSIDHTGDAGSIRSGRSLGSTVSQAIRHPDLHATGLNSSIVESVSATFEGGRVVSGSLTGEIALAYNPTDFSSPFGTDNIRLQNFSNLEKVAPNPAFVNQIPGREGDYAVNLSGIGKTQVAFKYQARVAEPNSIAPLLVNPAFKIEPNQASVIVSYGANPAFDLYGQSSIHLSNVTIALTLEGATASGCLSRPVGTFARERNLIFWQLGDVTLQTGAAPEKLLARFTTDVEAKSGSVEAKWEITGDQAVRLGSGLTVQNQAGGSGNDGADPFADEHAGSAGVWKTVPGVKKLASGHGGYVAR